MLQADRRPLQFELLVAGGPWIRLGISSLALSNRPLTVSRSASHTAKSEINIAREDDPLWPQIYFIEMPLASSAHDDARALAAAQKCLQFLPNSPWSANQCAWSLFEAGRYQDAIDQWRTMALMERDQDRVSLEERRLEAFRKAGVGGYAQVRLQASLSNWKSPHSNDFVSAEWFAFTGQRARRSPNWRRWSHVMTMTHYCLPLILCMTAYIVISDISHFSAAWACLFRKPVQFLSSRPRLFQPAIGPIHGVRNECTTRALV